MSHSLLRLGSALLLSLPAVALAQETQAPATGAAEAAAPVSAPTPAAVDGSGSATAKPVEDRGGEFSAEPVPPSPLVSERASRRDSKLRLAPTRAPRGDEDAPSLLGRKVVIGGYGSVDVDYTRMFGKDGAVLGLEGALLFNHRLSVGLAGYVWTNPQEGPADVDGSPRDYDVGYLGGTLRYSFLTEYPAYVTVGTFFGGGAIMLGPHNDDDDDRHWDRTRHDGFVVVQPDVTVHVNIVPWLRMGATAGYRWTSGVGRFGFEESDINGVVLGGHVQVGRF